MTVQILRLKEGSDIICDAEIIDGMVELVYPMMFQLVNQNLVLQHWLPLAAMKGNSVKISIDEIVCFMEPNDAFQEYYNTAVNKVTNALEMEQEEDIDDMVSAMEEMENTKGLLIH
jgi:hypothetical protein